MTETGVAPWIVRQIEGNLWAIFAAIFAAFAAYLIGTTTTGHRLAALEEDVAKLEGKLDALAPRVERLDVQAELAREQKKEAE
jgi:hypothetical protein